MAKEVHTPTETSYDVRITLAGDHDFCMSEQMLPWLQDADRPGYFYMELHLTDITDMYGKHVEFEVYDFLFSDPNTAFHFKMRFG